MDFPQHDIDKFWRKVLIIGSSDCWNWQGSKLKTGYGFTTLNGKPFRAHRFSLMLVCSPLNVSFFACHTCDNPSCVNPRHLYWGTAFDNMQDLITRNEAWLSKQRKRIAATMRKLCQKDVAVMRAMREAGATYQELSKRFNVSTSSAHRICSREYYRDT